MRANPVLQQPCGNGKPFGVTRLRLLQAYASIVGLHRSVFSAIPLFVVYLATLVHVYALSRQRTQEVSTAPPPSAAATCTQDLESGRPSRIPDNPNANPTSGDSSMGRVRHGLFQAWQGLKGFMLAVCSASERPLHFVKVEFPHSQGIYMYALTYVLYGSSWAMHQQVLF